MTIPAVQQIALWDWHLEDFISEQPVRLYTANISIKNGAICKTIFSPKLCVMLEILSSEYQSYACGKFSRMPLF